MLFKNRFNKTFSDLKIGDFFTFKYESRGNPAFYYTPILKKISDVEYAFAWGPVYNDRRKASKRNGIIKIKGFASPSAYIYEALWESSELEWSLVRLD